MSDDYTPSIAYLRDIHVMSGGSRGARGDEFDAAMAAHDAEVAAKAVAPVLAIHHPDESHPARCIGCVDPLDEGWVYWPCATVRALGVES